MQAKASVRLVHLNPARLELAEAVSKLALPTDKRAAVDVSAASGNTLLHLPPPRAILTPFNFFAALQLDVAEVTPFLLTFLQSTRAT
jgi:hypothetical protein